MDSTDGLSPVEVAVLSVFKLRRIRAGYGLTATTFRKELPQLPLQNITTGICTLLDKGYIETHPVIQDFYMLTVKGYRQLAE